MSLYQVTCDACSYERRISDCLRSYVLGDGEDLRIIKRHAWCRGCQQAVDAEVVPGDEELRMELAGIEDGSLSQLMRDIGEKPGMTIMQWIEKRRVETLARIEWKKHRASPPRCLECGSTEIVYFSDATEGTTGDDEEEMPSLGTVRHPDCGGTLRLVISGFSRNLTWPKYDAEGKGL